MERSEEINQLAAALAQAQAGIGAARQSQKAVVPHKTGGSHEYRYASLADVWEVCRKPLADNGLAIVQCPETDDGMMRLNTLLLHASGQWISSLIIFGLSEATPQAIGSLITYGRRYALMAMVGIAPDEDDDAQAAATSLRPLTPIQDADEHWCVEHNVPFFRRGQMKNYAHKLSDGTWHNEPSKAPAKPEAPAEPSDHVDVYPAKPPLDTHLMDYRPHQAREDIAAHLQGRMSGDWDLPPSLGQDKDLLRVLDGQRLAALLQALGLKTTRGTIYSLTLWLTAVIKMHGEAPVIAAVDGIIAAADQPTENAKD